MDYACFGDAVSFDTTFQTNKFEMPFAPLLGTNYHKQTIIFGAALLYNETIPSFIWLFETFLTAMSGKHPSTIFTDQDAAMAGAIAYVFPNTRHRLCLWHIYLNAAKHLGHVINKHPQKFLPVFKQCVYEDRSKECFKRKWNKLLDDYNLKDNSWLLNLYELRKNGQPFIVTLSQLT
jgi:zinc finger SWIM domain-containing protein 3